MDGFMSEQRKTVIVDGWRREGVNLSDDRMDMFFSFIVNGSIALIRKWAADDMKNTPAQIAALIEHAESTRLIDIKSDATGFVKHTSDAFRSLDKDTKKTINSVVIKSFSAAKKAIKDKP